MLWSIFYICYDQYLGDKYVNGEIIPCQYPTYQPKPRKQSKYESKKYVRQRDGPPAEQKRPKQEAASSESPSSWYLWVHKSG